MWVTLQTHNGIKVKAKAKKLREMNRNVISNPLEIIVERIGKYNENKAMEGCALTSPFL